MRVRDTPLQGPLLFEPHVHGDERGFFVETYRASVLAEAGVRDTFVQDNHSRSGRGVVRGIHFSIGDGQAKLVRCARGSILDVVVDLRRGFPPSVSGRATSWTTAPCARSTCRSASATASA